ncbi:MAG: histidine--tRNA ligase [Desulfobulbaceae bacterium]
MNIKAVQGFKDILPEEAILWQHIEHRARDIFHRFGFAEIRLPLLEETELFARSIGQATDIVEKEMYTFPDKGLTLRPEATASLLRAFIEHGLHVQQPVQRLYTMGPMFRHERPQKGRLRQFHQLDAEIIGAVEPAVDAELLAMASMLLTELGLAASLEINSLGCPDCRPAYREQLVGYLRQFAGQMCPDCQRRMESNPLRALDCKSQHCKKVVADAPSILDALCQPCRDHFGQVREGLERLAIPYSVNRFMVRGLDYYTRTTFEFTTTSLGAQSAVGAGGRYDGLIAQLGGPSLPGIGFAMGIERLILLLQQQDGLHLPPAVQADIFVAALGNDAARYSQLLVYLLRQGGVKAAMDHSGRSLKAQMKQAGRLGAHFALIIGDNELAQEKAVLRDMASQSQEDFSLQGSPQSCADSLHTLVTNRLPSERPDHIRRK